MHTHTETHTTNQPLTDLSAGPTCRRRQMPRPLPGGPHGPRPWKDIQVIAVQNNDLVGSLPEIEYGAAPVLSTINCANNSLEG